MSRHSPPRHYALLIGINQYEFFPSLQYAEQDAQHVYNFLHDQAKFDATFLFTDNSPKQRNITTKPTRSYIRDFLLEMEKQGRFLDRDSSFWFFFSGHGLRHDGYDFLMPSDGNPKDPSQTGIPVHSITSLLSRTGAGSIVIILDACRNEGSKGGGFGTKFEGVTTIYSCKATEMSWEVSELGHGAFTYALVENLKAQIQHDQGQTIREMEHHIRAKVSALVKEHKNRTQTPHIQCDSISNSNQVLLPKFALKIKSGEIRTEALKAEADCKWDRAINLWTRFLDMEDPNKDTAEIVKRITGIQQKKELESRALHGYKGVLETTQAVQNPQQIRTPLPTPQRTNINRTNIKQVSKRQANPIALPRQKLVFGLLVIVSVVVWVFIGHIFQELAAGIRDRDAMPMAFFVGAIGGAISGALIAASIKQLGKAIKITNILPAYLLTGFISGAVSWALLSQSMGRKELGLAGFLMGIATAITMMVLSNWKRQS